MPPVLKRIKKTVASTLPNKKELADGRHPHLSYVMLLLRNILVGCAAILFVLSLCLASVMHTLKAIAYFCGALAYFFECILITDFFHKKVPHREMFMIYCFGPLYLLLGFGYI